MKWAIWRWVHKHRAWVMIGWLTVLVAGQFWAARAHGEFGLLVWSAPIIGIGVIAEIWYVKMAWRYTTRDR